MADGEINRNGATIRIDDDGGVQVEPAEGQEVEYTGPDRGTDAIRDSVNTEQAGRGEGNLWEESSSWTTNSISFREDPDDVSSDSFTNLTQTDDSIGAVVPRLQDGVSLYGNFLVRADSVPSGETGHYRPRVVLRAEGDVNSIGPMEELEIEVTEDNNGERMESGWQEITSFDPTNWTIIFGARVSAKVSGGTMESESAGAFHLLFDRRVD